MSAVPRPIVEPATDVVLDVQLQCIEYTKTGNTVKGRQEFSIELLTEGMVKLGLLTSPRRTDCCARCAMCRSRYVEPRHCASWANRAAANRSRRSR